MKRKRNRNILFCLCYLIAAALIGSMLIQPAVTKSAEVFCAKEEHAHLDNCFDPHDEQMLLCEKEEHTHSLQCFSNPEADVENKADWQSGFFQADGSVSASLADMARSQAGYHASVSNYLVGEDGNMQGWNRYGSAFAKCYEQNSIWFVQSLRQAAGMDLIDYPENETLVSPWLKEKEIEGSLQAFNPQTADGTSVFFHKMNSDEVLCGICLTSQSGWQVAAYLNQEVTLLKPEQFDLEAFDSGREAESYQWIGIWKESESQNSETQSLEQPEVSDSEDKPLLDAEMDLKKENPTEEDLSAQSDLNEGAGLEIQSDLNEEKSLSAQSDLNEEADAELNEDIPMAVSYTDNEILYEGLEDADTAADEISSRNTDLEAGQMNINEDEWQEKQTENMDEYKNDTDAQSVQEDCNENMQTDLENMESIAGNSSNEESNLLHAGDGSDNPVLETVESEEKLNLFLEETDDAILNPAEIDQENAKFSHEEDSGISVLSEMEQASLGNDSDDIELEKENQKDKTSETRNAEESQYMDNQNLTISRKAGSVSEASLAQTNASLLHAKDNSRLFLAEQNQTYTAQSGDYLFEVTPRPVQNQDADDSQKEKTEQTESEEKADQDDEDIQGSKQNEKSSSLTSNSAGSNISGQNRNEPDTVSSLNAGDHSEQVKLEVIVQDAPEYSDWAKSVNEEENTSLISLNSVSFSLKRGEDEIDLEGYDLDVTITPKTSSIEKLEEESYPDAAKEANTDIVISLKEDTGTISTSYSTRSENWNSLHTTVSGNETVILAQSDHINPEFTVQYYAYLDEIHHNTSKTANTAGQIQIIDTSNKRLPQNGKGASTSPNSNQLMTVNMVEVENQSNIFVMESSLNLEECYKSRQFNYISAPNAAYFNELIQNGNYALNEIWVLKSGKNPESTQKSDWNVYQPDNAHFTNSSQDTSKILISDGDTIRMVYRQTQGIYQQNAEFYDYDITNDGNMTAANTTDENFRGQGINSNSNYSGSGSHLAFGNANSGTGMWSITYKDSNGVKNLLNQFNKSSTGGTNSFQGCAFKLASSLKDGRIQYSSGISAPNLFNDGAAAGKTEYSLAGNQLEFSRRGDTYTLKTATVVSGTQSSTITNLDQFNKPKQNATNYHNGIFTNNFWPMDSFTNKDPHTGKTGDLKTFKGYDKTAYTSSKKYPVSDDYNISRNNMFGMHYIVNFELDGDYTGPLEYYFFGDDDMWVFLSNDGGKTGQLICDIGGIHSSVGAYVNLWDYIEKGTEGSYSLHFFYTERGLSGSTCFMEYTLPSVHQDNPQQNTGSLSVEKLGVHIDSNEEFSFILKLWGNASKSDRLLDNYAFDKYEIQEDGSELRIEQYIVYPAETKFTLKPGQRIEIYMIPADAYFELVENPPKDTEDFITSISTDDGVNYVYSESRQVTGTIEAGHALKFKYQNARPYNLPETGGRGTHLFYVAGGALILVGFVSWRYAKKQKNV